MILTQGQRIITNVPLMSGWMGVGVVLTDMEEGDDVVVFRKEAIEPSPENHCMCILSEVSVIGQDVELAWLTT